MKAQAANAVSTVAKKVGYSLSDEERKSLLDILLSGLSGRTWSGKQHLLAAVVDLCKYADKNTTLNKNVIFDAIFRESRKKEPVYRKFAIMALGNLFEAFDEDRFEEFYSAFSDLLKMDVASMEMDSEDITEKAESRKNYLALKEVIWESFGKAWPNNFETQDKYRTQFLDMCSDCLKMNTRNIQLQIMIAMNTYTIRLILVQNSNTVSQDHMIQVVDKMVSIILYALDISFTSVKKEALGIIQTMIMKVKEHNLRTIYDKLARTVSEEITPKVISDKAPEIQSRIKDIQDNLKFMA